MGLLRESRADSNVQALVKKLIIIVITKTRATPSYMESLPSIFIVVLAVSMTTIFIHLNYMYVCRLSPKFSLPFLVHCYLLLFPSIIVVVIISCSSLSAYQWPGKSVTLNLFFLFLDVLAVELTPQGNKWTNYPPTSMVLSCTVNRKKETGYYENLKTGKWKLDLLICYQ